MSSMLLEFFCECGDEMFGWSRGFGVFVRSWSGFQVLSEVADMMVGYWSVAYKAVGLGTKRPPCAFLLRWYRCLRDSSVVLYGEQGGGVRGHGPELLLD